MRLSYPEGGRGSGVPLALCRPTAIVPRRNSCLQKYMDLPESSGTKINCVCVAFQQYLRSEVRPALDHFPRCRRYLCLSDAWLER